jgi:putative DNA primase/helicase
MKKLNSSQGGPHSERSVEKLRKLRLRLKERAVQYAQKGFAVVPMHTVKNGKCSCSKGAKCPSPGKHPWNSNGVNGASTSKAQIRKWWNDHPEANVGLACGSKSNVLALDVDPRNGGNETLDNMIWRLGSLNSTAISNTGGGGTHYFFELPEFQIRKDSGGKVFGPGVDVTSDGAIIVVPPSVHASGKTYRWREGASLLNNSPARLPKKWREFIKMQQSSHQPKLTESEVIVTGARNDTLTGIAGKLHNAGIGPEALLAALMSENKRCQPPLDEDEVAKIANSVGKYLVKPNATTQGDLAERVMTSVLDRCFGGGDRLIFAKDGQFWMYNGKFWEPAQLNWLNGQTLKAIQDMTERGGKATSTIVGQVAVLLRAKLAVNDDPLRFIGSPLPVLNCSNGELWIDPEGAVELRPHRVKSYLRHCLDVDYDPDATCPLYDAAVKEIFSCASPTPKGMVRHWHEFVGYLMQPRRDIPLVGILKGGRQ